MLGLVGRPDLFWSQGRAQALALAAFVLDEGGEISTAKLSKFYVLHPEGRACLSVGVPSFCNTYPDLLRFEGVGGAGKISSAPCEGSLLETCSVPEINLHPSSDILPADADDGLSRFKGTSGGVGSALSFPHLEKGAFEIYDVSENATMEVLPLDVVGALENAASGTRAVRPRKSTSGCTSIDRSGSIKTISAKSSLLDATGRLLEEVGGVGHRAASSVGTSESLLTLSVKSAALPTPRVPGRNARASWASVTSDRSSLCRDRTHSQGTDARAGSWASASAKSSVRSSIPFPEVDEENELDEEDFDGEADANRSKGTSQSSSGRVTPKPVSAAGNAGSKKETLQHVVCLWKEHLEAEGCTFVGADRGTMHQAFRKFCADRGINANRCTRGFGSVMKALQRLGYMGHLPNSIATLPPSLLEFSSGLRCDTHLKCDTHVERWHRHQQRLRQQQLPAQQQVSQKPSQARASVSSPTSNTGRSQQEQVPQKPVQARASFSSPTSNTGRSPHGSPSGSPTGRLNTRVRSKLSCLPTRAEVPVILRSDPALPVQTEHALPASRSPVARLPGTSAILSDLEHFIVDAKMALQRVVQGHNFALEMYGTAVRSELASSSAALRLREERIAAQQEQLALRAAQLARREALVDAAKVAFAAEAAAAERAAASQGELTFELFVKGGEDKDMEEAVADACKDAQSSLREFLRDNGLSATEEPHDMKVRNAHGILVDVDDLSPEDFPLTIMLIFEQCEVAAQTAAAEAEAEIGRRLAALSAREKGHASAGSRQRTRERQAATV